MRRSPKLIKSVAGLGLATLFLLAQGCSTVQPKLQSSDYFISNKEIHTIMFYDNLDTVERGSDITDDYYMCPDEYWLANRFALVILPHYLAERKASKWIAQSNDCDDFALHALSLMREIHHNTPYKLPSTGIAFGVISYLKSGVGLHMINWAIVRDSATKLPKLIFFEPQDSKGVIELSDKEKRSIIFWMI